MLELTAPIASEDREALEFYLFEGEELHPWILYDDTKTGEMSVQGIFESDAEARAAWAKLAAELRAAPEPAIREIEDKDWKESYKEHFQPWSYEGIHWVPLWLKDEYKLPEGESAVYLDPGMAFGTGNHETTRLCVERLLEIDPGSEGRGALRVMDAGTGSGILAISAKKAGFTQTYAFDNDPDAVRVACDNAVLNDELEMHFDIADLETGFVEPPYDVIVANILAHVLIDHRESIVKSLETDGWLILSGILKTEADKVVDAFKPMRKWSSVEVHELGEWSSVTLKG